MSKQIEEKQRYLRENILDKDYDAEEFMDFCENTHGSTDIDTWTLAELKEIVQQFISTNTKTLRIDPFTYSAPPNNPDPFDWDHAFQPPPHRQPQPEINLNFIDIDFLETMGMSPSPPKTANKVPPQPVSLTTDPKQILAKLNSKDSEFISAYNAAALQSREKQSKPEKQPEPLKVDFSSREQKIEVVKEVPSPVLLSGREVVEETFKTSVKCRTFSNKSKLEGDLQVVVSSHEVVNPNIFVPNFVLYTVVTNPIGREVKRRLKDFEMLRTLLKRIFPSVQIPHLERYGRLSETEPSVIRKQKMFLESFLNSILLNRSLRCRILDDFLLLENLDQLKKQFREFEKLEKPKSIEDLYNSEGKVELQMGGAGRKFIAQQQLYFDYLQPNLMKLKELYDQLLLSFANSVKLLGEISTLCDNLRDGTRNVNALLPENQRSLKFEEALTRIAELHRDWASGIKTQARGVETEIRHLYRFEHANVETIREVCKQSEGMSEAYGKRNDREQAAREQYEYNKKLNEYKVGVEVVSKNTTVLRHQAAYFMESAVGEVQRFLGQLAHKMLQKYRTLSVLQLNINNELDGSWKQFEQFASQK